MSVNFMIEEQEREQAFQQTEIEASERDIAYARYRDLKRATLGQAMVTGPVELEPLQPSQRRMFFSRESFLDFLRSGLFSQLLDTNDLVTQLTIGGEFAVTVIAKSQGASERSSDQEESQGGSEISEKADDGVSLA